MLCSDDRYQWWLWRFLPLWVAGVVTESPDRPCFRSPVQSAAKGRSRRLRSGERSAHRHHRSRESKLQQSVLRLSRRQDADIRLDLEQQEDSAEADFARNNVGHAAQRSRVLIACNGTGKKIPGTDCQMNGFDKEWLQHPVKPAARNQVSPLCVCSARRNEAVFRYGPAVRLGRRDVRFGFRFSSFESHQYIIAGRKSEFVLRLSRRRLGMPGRPEPTRSHPLQKPKWMNEIRPHGERPCWDPNTLGDELDKAGYRGRSMRSPCEPRRSFGGRRQDGLPSGSGRVFGAPIRPSSTSGNGQDWAQRRAPCRRRRNSSKTSQG